MATYVNNLRLKEIATGDESGTWGTSTNTNLELIGEALGIGTEAITTNADTHTTTVADGSADAGRAMYLKYTGTLDSACTITIGPNTMKRVQIIENATSGSQNIIISQGSGANVTIANGKVAIVQLDGAGAGAAVLDVLTDLQLSDSLTLNGPTLTIGDATAEDTKIVFDGNAQDYYVGLDDSTDDLVIGLGSAVGTTPGISIDENQFVTMPKKVTASTSANISQVAITSSSNAVAWDARAAANAYHVTTENTTFSAPSNAVEGAIISVEIAQGGTARTIAWNTVFEFAASTAPTITATANKTDILAFRYNGSVWQEIGRVQNLAQT
jgi:hypothetical protein